MTPSPTPPRPPGPARRAGRTAAEAAALTLDEGAVAALRARLPEVAELTVAEIMAAVPAYNAPFRGRMGRVITQAVQTSLASFLEAAGSAPSGDDASIGVGVQAAEELGRVEARAGRPVEALLSAYRVGAGVSWRELSRMAVAAEVDAATLGRFAEVVFTYIDELSAASVAGHNAETASADRIRLVHRDRLARALLVGAPEAELTDAARSAGWAPPRTLTAVLLAPERLANTAAMLDPRTLTVEEPPAPAGFPAPGEASVLLVPDAGGPARPALLDLLAGRSASIGPARPWTAVGQSYARALRGRELGVEDTDAALPALVLGADPAALADLRTATLSPFADLPESTAERLAETLRAWLLLQGRRELVAEHLHVHPQTVRYRMGQLRELFGERLQDPDEVLAILLALSAPTGSAGG